MSCKRLPRKRPCFFGSVGCSLGVPEYLQVGVIYFRQCFSGDFTFLKGQSPSISRKV
jgi:hypothetical protein